MAEQTKIEWCDHTFNPWIGCAKVHQGCTNCYAEADMDKRRGRVQWGPNGTRSKTSDDYWKQPLKWNRQAKEEGRRHRVFCASLADIFETWEGPIVNHLGRTLFHENFGYSHAPEDVPTNVWTHATMDDLRSDLFRLIDATPHLDWLLLTKRPENIRKMWPNGFGIVSPSFAYRKNVFLGTSVSDQETADKQIPELLKCHDLAPVLFLSIEPMLGPVDLDLVSRRDAIPDVEGSQYKGTCLFPGGIDWVIVGGESGPNARPMHPMWVRTIRDQCRAAGVPFFFKQWGEYGAGGVNLMTGEPVFREFSTITQWVNKADTWVNGGVCVDTSGRRLMTGGDFEQAHRERTFPVAVMHPIGKKKAGRRLDGREWMQFPQPRSQS